MQSIDHRALKFVLENIKEGTLFESFIQNILSVLFGKNFQPAGGIHDKGIDGIEAIYSPEGQKTNIFQISIEKDVNRKIIKTLQALNKNDIQLDQFTMVSNQRVDNLYKLQSDLFTRYKIPITIYDIGWLAGQIASNEAAARLYYVFVDSHVHVFARRPSEDYVISDLTTDPRVLVFLRQQGITRRDNSLGEALTDSLILFALEGTDPDKGKLLSHKEILNRIVNLIPDAEKIVSPLLEDRLSVLSAKPRRIKLHTKKEAYCLPFKTRVELEEKQLADQSLHEDFFAIAAEKFLGHYYGGPHIIDKDRAASLTESVLSECFRRQGLEFADFVLKGSSESPLQARLPDIVNDVVSAKNVEDEVKDQVAGALLATIRSILYSGTDVEIEYLKKLSDTYLMVFLLQADPKVSAYFAAMAAQLRIFVGNSILVPALSESLLLPIHQRHGKLLKAASLAGVDLFIDRGTLEELAAHLRKITHIYEQHFEPVEDVYMDEMMIGTIDEIMIRAYYYNRLNGKIDNFNNFIDTFATPNGARMGDELAAYLLDTYSIKLASETSLGVRINEREFDELVEILKPMRGSAQQARSDARTALTIMALRERDNEQSQGGRYGYRTWWLSNEVKTEVALREYLGDRFVMTCYMRPDFLYNYIALAPSVAASEELFDILFPGMLGVALSHHIDPRIGETIHAAIVEHSNKSPARVRSIVRTTLDKLKSDPKFKSPKRLQHYMDEQLKKE